MLYPFDRSFLITESDLIVGIDEAGRGPLAGPVVASAVILPLDKEIADLNDSKQLSEKKRDRIFIEIQEKALSFGVGIVSHEEIDEINILNATIKAMHIAISQLTLKPDLYLTDAVKLKGLDKPVFSIVRGDTKSASIAAASVVAKVTRDRIMKDYHKVYPSYLFFKNKGYPTLEHRNILKKVGPCPIHRKTFSPVKDYFNK